MVRQFLHVTKEGTSDDAAAHFGPASGRERALLSLAAAGFHLAAAHVAPSPRMRALGLDECSRALAAARRACSPAKSPQGWSEAKRTRSWPTPRRSMPGWPIRYRARRSW